MKVLFLTNMPAYHQIELANQFNKLLGNGNFRLSVHAPLNDERKQMQWNDSYQLNYLLRFSETEYDRATTIQWIESADVVIHGRFPIKYVRNRIKAGGLTFAYQERFWKKPKSLHRLISRAAHLYRNYYSVNRPNYHLLAAGHCAADDMHRLGLFRQRAWKFGYFIDPIAFKQRPATPLKLVWCGRMIGLKQPQLALQVACALRDAGADFSLTMIGGGELYDDLLRRTERLGLKKNVRFTNWLSVAEVNTEMASSHILLMTSNQREGWGMVINEAINNGCLVVANEAIGAARWLIDSGRTGLVYQQNDVAQMIEAVVGLCADPGKLQSMAQAGHRRLISQWSTPVAASRLIQLCESLLAGKPAVNQFENGPCSAIAKQS